MKKLAPQETRTYFISTSCDSTKRVFQVERMSDLLKSVILTNREKQRYQLHAFVIMPDHLHLLLTPAPEVSLEKAVQFIKGGFSFLAKKELGYIWEVWQRSFNEHQIKDRQDYDGHVSYIHENPVRAHLVDRVELYPWSSYGMDLDPMPFHFRDT